MPDTRTLRDRLAEAVRAQRRAALLRHGVKLDPVWHMAWNDVPASIREKYAEEADDFLATLPSVGLSITAMNEAEALSTPSRQEEG